MTPPKEHNNPPELAPELKEIYEMAEMEFRIMVVRKFNDARKYRQIKEMRKPMSEMNENITKELELIKKNQINILQMNSSVSEVKSKQLRILAKQSTEFLTFRAKIFKYSIRQK